MYEGHLEEGLVYNLPSLAEELLDCRRDFGVWMNRVRLWGHYLCFTYWKIFLGLFRDLQSLRRNWLHIQSDRDVCLMSFSYLYINFFIIRLPPF